MSSWASQPACTTVDLHVHTTASDGQLSPAELVHRAIGLGLKTIAITDHDTTDGIAQALEVATGTGLSVIPGVEISADMAHSEIHILGYYVAHQDPVLCDTLALLRAARLDRACKIVNKLTRMGMPVKWERVRQYADGSSIGRPHIAQAMLETGHVSSVDEAFRRYLGRNGPAYVDRYKLAPAEAVQTILAASGLPVLAHPLRDTHLLPELIHAGLVGLEAYYTNYAQEDTAFLLQLASKYGLLVTGGSDFHGEAVQRRHELGAVAVPEAVVAQLRACYERRLSFACRGND
jgi:predicted metal-dependent phosphoesterase TrpH